MKKVLGIFKWAVVFFTFSSHLYAYEIKNLDKPHIPNQVIIKFKVNATHKVGALAVEKISALSRLGGKVEHQFKSSDSYLISFDKQVDAKTLKNNVDALASEFEIEYAEANTVLTMDVIPNDPRFKESYGLYNDGSKVGNIQAIDAWEQTKGSSSVLVAVIDTGIDYNHEDLKDNLWTNPGESGDDAEGKPKFSNGIDDDNNGYIDDYRGWNFVNNTNNPWDDAGHGTHCAGVIGAKGNNALGTSGVNWNVSLMGLKFLNGQGSGSLADAVKALEYATMMKVFLTSNSWGGGGYSDTMMLALKNAESHGMLFIAAAGNNHSDNDASPHYPSSYEVSNVIAVAASDQNDALASFSNYGKKSVHVAAPGVGILSSYPPNTYKLLSGTSMATPFVAGLAALVKSLYPELTGAEIKKRILSSSDAVNGMKTRLITGARINATSALANDHTPPSSVKNISIISSEINSLTMTWSPSGDDEDQGQAAHYDVKIALTPINNESDWQGATDVEYAPLEAANTYKILELPIASSGYIAVRAVDKAGNISALSPSLAFATSPMKVLSVKNASSIIGIKKDKPWGVETLRNKKFFSDSPGALYGESKNVSLSITDYSISQQNILLSFDSIYDLEDGYDFVYVEISMDKGKKWSVLTTLTGQSPELKNTLIDLKSYMTKSTNKFYLRFRLVSDYSVQKDGIKIESVKILGAS